MMKSIIFSVFLTMTFSSCEKHGDEENIVNGSCTGERKSSIACGQKETVVPSEIQLNKICQLRECENLNVSKPVFILNDKESKKSLLSLGCREDLVEVEDGLWKLSVMGMQYPRSIIFIPAKETSHATCGMFEIDKNEAVKICNFLGRDRIGGLGCMRSCDETTYDFCSTEDPALIEMKGIKILPVYPSIELRE